MSRDTDRVLFELIPDVGDIGKSLELAEEYGMAFEYDDFMMPQMLDRKEECRKLVSFYKNLGRDCSQDTMHGVFLDIAVHSVDSLIREASRRRVCQSMEIAQELGLRGVVFHTGLLSDFRDDYYQRKWLEENVSFWTKILHDYPRQEVYMENMFERDGIMCARIGEAMKSEPRFGLCLDYAHAQAFGDSRRIEEWFRIASSHIRHMHINDNDLKDDLHLPIGKGSIDWKQFVRLMSWYRPKASILLEMRGYEAQKASAEYMRKLGILKI